MLELFKTYLNKLFCCSDECGSDSENETNLDEVDNVSEPSSTDESNKDPSEPTLSIGPPETG